MKLREATLTDVPAIQAIYAHYVQETPITFEEEVPDHGTMAARMKAAHAYLVAEDHTGIVGYAYGSEHRSRAAYRFSCDVSIYVANRAQRQGVGRALYGALLPRLKTLGLHNAYAGITLPNTGSVALHEAFGFHHLGTYRQVGWKFGAWQDVGWWEKRL